MEEEEPLPPWQQQQPLPPWAPPPRLSGHVNSSPRPLLTPRLPSAQVEAHELDGLLSAQAHAHSWGLPLAPAALERLEYLKQAAAAGTTTTYYRAQVHKEHKEKGKDEAKLRVELSDGGSSMEDRAHVVRRRGALSVHANLELAKACNPRAKDVDEPPDLRDVAIAKSKRYSLL